MIDWNKYRSYFPHLKDQIYLNHAAISPMHTLAQKSVQKFILQRREKNIEFWPDAVEQKQQFKKSIGQLINADDKNIALVQSTSAGLNILALGLEWKGGDRILLNNFEFPSNVIPFTNLKRLGVEIDFVHHRDGAIYIEDIVDNIKPRTKVLSISFVEFLNGYRNDLKTIGGICHKKNIILSVDAIQGLGALKMDVQDMNIDFLSCGGHKWLMWPAGVAIVYISPKLFDRIYPTQAGWLSVENPFDFFNYDQPFAATAQRFEPGAFNVMGMMAAQTSLSMMLEITTSQIEKKTLSNTNYLINLLNKEGFTLYTKEEENSLSGIVTFYYDKAEELHSFLKKKRITVSLREGKIRISPHFYNNYDDLNKLMNTVKEFEGS
jgi:cysteine desulfurase/selenocysteine lyase